jgi:hypothetical protein
MSKSRAVITALFVMNWFAVSNACAASESVQPMGSFSRTQGDDGEHADGHRIQLWRVGNTIVGQLTYWESNIEGQMGDFSGGTYNPKTGAIRFKVTVERHDITPKEYSTASFDGQVKGNSLVGILKWEGEVAKWRGKDGTEKLTLPKDSTSRLLPFKDLSAWQENPYGRYKHVE